MNEYSCALPIRHTTIMNDKKQNKTKKTKKKKGRCSAPNMRQLTVQQKNATKSIS